MKKYSESDALYHLQYCLKNKIYDCFYGVWESFSVHYGEDGGFDKNVAIEKGLKCYDIKKKGGAMVTQPGDICYAYLTNSPSDFNTQLKLFLVKKLKDKGIDAEMVKNDLLICGKKFLGDMKQYWNGVYFYGGHISLSVNLNLIKEICTKPMEKIPTGLREYGVKDLEVEEWLDEFWFWYKK